MPSLHNKTHFKAATSIFLNHRGSLEDTDRSVEKILNDFTVKRNLQQLLAQPNLKPQKIKINYKSTKTPDPTRNRNSYFSNFSQSNNISKPLNELNIGTATVQERREELK